jgi:predicted MFS family arabinose efflux permease
VALFALAGLGCSALLPLTITFGQQGLAVMSAAMAGAVIAFYQVGYGLAAFGVGPLLDAGHHLSTLYVAAAVVTIAMWLLSFLVVRGVRSVAWLHPRPLPSPTAPRSDGPPA